MVPEKAQLLSNIHFMLMLGTFIVIIFQDL
jgi:hypothetical protein